MNRNLVCFLLGILVTSISIIQAVNAYNSPESWLMTGHLSTRVKLNRISQAIHEQGKIPEENEDGFWDDAWHTHIQYKGVDKNTFTLTSLGPDKQPGGVGRDADLVVSYNLKTGEESPEGQTGFTKPTWKQLFACPEFQSTLIFCVLLGLSAAVLFRLLNSKDNQTVRQIGYFAALTFATSFVGGALILIQSIANGH